MKMKITNKRILPDLIYKLILLLIMFTSCTTAKNIATLLPYQLRCNDEDGFSDKICTVEGKCPELCKCAHGIVDCRDLKLTQVPTEYPPDTIELRLENNHITEIGPHAFRTAIKLKRIDLSRNKLKNVSAQAFATNKKLTALILFDNDLLTIPSSTLYGLNDLNIILLNKNKISCLAEDVFKHQNKLILLSLFDNNLQTLPHGIFRKLNSLASIHLGSNPWRCDCSLSWLTRYIRSNSVESSGAACREPPRLRDWTLESIAGLELQCDTSAISDQTCNHLISKSPGAEDHHQHQDHRRRKQQQPVNDDASYQRTSPCTDHDCQHGVCIATGGGNNYKCQCDQGYTGKRCEYLVSVQFVYDRTYIQLDPLFTVNSINMTLIVKTDQDSGVLLYTGDRQHLAVELFKGRLRVSFDVGNNPPSTIFSYEILSDDRTHAVQLLLHGRNLTMKIDDGVTRSVLNDGPKDRLRVTNALYLGGVPPDVGEQALGKWHLRNATSVRGCMKSFYINNKQMDFLQTGQRHGTILSGCQKRYVGMRTSSDHTGVEDGLELIRPRSSRKKGKDRRKRKTGCSAHKCRKEGTRNCQKKGRKDYKCQCKRGYIGRYCERAPTCRKKKTRNYIEENGCRSSKLISQNICAGQCHGDAGCCKPKKIKKRKIGMICQDGTRYARSIIVVKKCSCAKDRQCKNEKRY